MSTNRTIFNSISITPNELLVGMFSDPNLRPCQPWRKTGMGGGLGLNLGAGTGLPTPPDSIWGSGSASPTKPSEHNDGNDEPKADEGVACPEFRDELDQEMEVLKEGERNMEMRKAVVRTGEQPAWEEPMDLGTDIDMEIDTSLESEIAQEKHTRSVRPNTPPLPLSSPDTPDDDMRPESVLSAQNSFSERQDGNGSTQSPAADKSREPIHNRPLTPPLPEITRDDTLATDSDFPARQDQQTVGERMAIATLYSFA
jgi:hypothetical protein